MGYGAIGLIETMGSLGGIEALDASLKAASVSFLYRTFTGGGLVCTVVTGDVAAVKAAVDAGSAAAQRLGSLISSHVIPRADGEVFNMLSGPEVKDICTGEDMPKTEKHDPGSRMSEIVADLRKVVSDEEVQELLLRSNDIASYRVRELRKILRTLNIEGVHGRDISKMRKDQILNKLSEYHFESQA